MSLDLGTMYALVTLNDKDYKTKLEGLETSSNKTFQNIAKAAATYLTLRAVTSFVRGTVNMYSDLEEETNKFNVVFAGLGERTTEILAQMRKEFGLSELSAKRMLAGTGDMLTGFGFDPKLALVLSEGAAKLGADIASFSNYAGGAAGATTALTKAMLGEAESAKLLGVVIKQDSEEMKKLKEQAMTTGITIKALGDAGKDIIVSNENQAKAVAALALAYEQSPNAIGDFKRSQDSIANQTRILENNFEELTSKIGGDLAPAYLDALQAANKLVSAYNSLNPEVRSLVGSTVALSGAALLLGKAKLSILGIATAFKVAGAAAKGFLAGIGPIGVAILALGGAFAVAQAMYKKYTAELDASTQSANSRIDAAKKLSSAHRQESESASASFDRLKDLAKYERLSNDEKEEAERLIKTLTELYGDLGISIDTATGKLVIATGAFAKMSDEQRKIALKDVVKEYQAMIALTTSKGNELHNEVSDIFTNSLAYQAYNKLMRGFEDNPEWLELMDKKAFNDMQNQVSSAQKLNKTQDQLYAFQKIYQKLVEEGDNEEAQKVLDLIELLQKQLTLEKQISELRKKEGEKPKGGKDGKKVEEDAKKVRKALESLSETKWKISFDEASDYGKILELENKAQEIFSKQSGKYGSYYEFLYADAHKMNLQEIKDQEKLIELEAEKARIRRDSWVAFTNEEKEYQEIIAQQQKRNKETKVEKEIRSAERYGDSTLARAIMERELASALKAAKETEASYKSALKLAFNDKIYTAEEQKKVEELKRKWQESLSDQDKWQGRIDAASEAEQRKVHDTVGAWSLELLASQLGASKPEVETAKNTKRTKELLEDIKDNLNTGVAYQ